MDRSTHHDFRGRLQTLLTYLDDRLSSDELEWGQQFIDQGEFVLALEMMADWLSESDGTIAEHERELILGLQDDMRMDDRVQRIIDQCPRKPE